MMIDVDIAPDGDATALNMEVSTRYISNVTRNTYRVKERGRRSDEVEDTHKNKPQSAPVTVRLRTTSTTRVERRDLAHN